MVQLGWNKKTGSRKQRDVSEDSPKSASLFVNEGYGNHKGEEKQDTPKLKQYDMYCQNCQTSYTADLEKNITCCNTPKILINVKGDDDIYRWISLSEFLSFERAELMKDGELRAFQKKQPPITQEAVDIFSREGQCKEFHRRQPYFYDKTGSFWIWNFELTRWERCDDIDILNYVADNLNENIINSKNRQEILNGLKQEGRRHIPKEIKSTWVQFKNKIYDVENEDVFYATPDYFVTNPLPWEVSHNPETPAIDALFQQWVGEEYAETLHEILAYCMLPDYPIHRLFCLVGGGSNGKGSYLRLLKHFLGAENITSTELDMLLNSRFEVTKLYRKLLCQMSETNFNQMDKTSILKKLTGGDLIGFEYKNKDQFDSMNYAKIIISTNTLPTTGDKTEGFYRRWCIIDFPNKFQEQDDPVYKISYNEMCNLATYALIKLKELLKSHRFTGEGDEEERRKRYEDRSNPLEKFLHTFTEEDADGFIWKWEFQERFNGWCRDNRHRVISESGIGRKMKELGIADERRVAEFTNELGENKRWRAWVGIKWKKGVNNE